MPRSSLARKGGSKFVGFKLDEVSDRFYRRKAQEAGLTLSDYIRKLLMQGVVNDNIQSLEQRIQALTAHLHANPVAAAPPGDTVSANTEVVTAIFLCREILSATMHDRDPQSLYKAQERARVNAEKVSGARRG
ncbi:hypothetical protein [Burkholderia glumae]|uniref:hypothetical protein n=1 Tax=Burkholderia glumae TaxID=337 RepID=UPI00156F3007|nr:hypothetical protein [Burkholderia glumae]QKM57673.1 hypothetical protein CG017_05752 [Burkholderia glumae]